ncbi:MAG: pyridoxamine 5'-phosphate oxidase [bacterium]
MPIDQDPIVRFNHLYEQFQRQAAPESSAAVLATATSDGEPSARIVLIRGVDTRGFVFYTNLESRKARELRQNPKAALCFYWETIHYQVRVEGKVGPVSEQEADEYFAGRPRGSQIGAWASRQSQILASRSALENRFAEHEQEFAGRMVPRPPFWSGFRLVHQRVEFWLRRDNRLHDRTAYLRKGDGWEIKLLYP